MSRSESFINSLVELNEEKLLKILDERLRLGDNPVDIINDVKKAAEIIGNKYESGEYFVADLIVAGEVMKKVMEKLKPLLGKVVAKKKGRIVVGTVEGDIHDIGKNLFIILAEAAGFEVIDLGVDVPSSKFVRAVKEHNPDVLAMSCLLTLGIENMKKTVEALNKAGLRDRVKVIIGGSPITAEISKYIEADAYATDALEGVKICLTWVKERG